MMFGRLQRHTDGFWQHPERRTGRVELTDFRPIPVKPPAWVGQRQVTGTIQTAWQEIAMAQLSLKQGIKEYDNLAKETTGAAKDLVDYLQLRGRHRSTSPTRNGTKSRA